MPNYCDFSLKVRGTEESVKKFKEILGANYDVSKGEENPLHFYRIFEADDDDNYEYDEETQIASNIFNGYCAWSVFVCMRSGQQAYYTSDNQDNGTCLEMLTKELNIAVEYFSEESGVGFQEHCIINNGEIELDDCVKWLELDIDECQSWKQLIKNNRYSILEYFYNELEMEYSINDLGGFKYSNDYNDKELKDAIREYIFKPNALKDTTYFEILTEKYNKIYDNLREKFEKAKQEEENWLSLGGFNNWDFSI